jgi:DNA-binding response OmpR family regulator
MPKVQIIENDKDIVHIVQYLLQSQGFEVDVVTNPVGAIHRAREFKPNIILLDVSPAGFDGRVICKELKQNYSSPVLIFSTSLHIAKECSDCGADGYISKPFDINAFVDTVKRYAN